MVAIVSLVSEQRDQAAAAAKESRAAKEQSEATAALLTNQAKALEEMSRLLTVLRDPELKLTVRLPFDNPHVKKFVEMLEKKDIGASLMNEALYAELNDKVMENTLRSLRAQVMVAPAHANPAVFSRASINTPDGPFLSMPMNECDGFSFNYDFRARHLDLVLLRLRPDAAGWESNGKIESLVDLSETTAVVRVQCRYGSEGERKAILDGIEVVSASWRICNRTFSTPILHYHVDNEPNDIRELFVVHFPHLASTDSSTPGSQTIPSSGKGH